MNYWTYQQFTILSWGYVTTTDDVQASRTKYTFFVSTFALSLEFSILNMTFIYLNYGMKK